MKHVCVCNYPSRILPSDCLVYPTRCQVLPLTLQSFVFMLQQQECGTVKVTHACSQTVSQQHARPTRAAVIGQQESSCSRPFSPKPQCIFAAAEVFLALVVSQSKLLLNCSASFRILTSALCALSVSHLSPLKVWPVGRGDSLCTLVSADSRESISQAVKWPAPL